MVLTRIKHRVQVRQYCQIQQLLKDSQTEIDNWHRLLKEHQYPYELLSLEILEAAGLLQHWKEKNTFLPHLGGLAIENPCVHEHLI